MNIMKKVLLALIALVACNVAANAGVRGDVNNDGVVSSVDITALYNWLLNSDDSAIVNGDLDGDGIITSVDITIIYNILLGNDNPETTEFEVDGVKFKMVNVEGGTFMMGANAGDPNAYDDEAPSHEVTVSSFAIGETEVTQELWLAVMGWNYSGHGGNLQYPVEYINWEMIQNFISKLNEMTGKNFRLPTEAEWEFAARGGNKSQNTLYSGSNNIADIAWYVDNSEGATHVVATQAPNELGIYDMSGNVWEWCNDWYGNYSVGAQNNPAGPASGGEKVMRGGSWYGPAKNCRVSKRFKASTGFGDDDIGFRLAL